MKQQDHENNSAPNDDFPRTPPKAPKYDDLNPGPDSTADDDFGRKGPHIPEDNDL